jgi:hypothetical protein
MRASDAAKIFVGAGMTDLTRFLSVVDKVEEEGMVMMLLVVS